MRGFPLSLHLKPIGVLNSVSVGQDIATLKTNTID